MTLPLWSLVDSAFSVACCTARWRSKNSSSVHSANARGVTTPNGFNPLEGILTDRLCFDLFVSISIIVISASANINTTVTNVRLGCDSSVGSSNIWKCWVTLLLNRQLDKSIFCCLGTIACFCCRRRTFWGEQFAREGNLPTRQKLNPVGGRCAS